MSDKHITLITGANTGIGLETAIALGASANNHVIIGSRSISKGQEAVTELISRKELLATYSLQQLDITSPGSISAAAKAITEAYGRIDCLVNNAGISPDSSHSLPDQLRQAVETNTVGALSVTEAFKPLLLASKDTPRLIYTSSVMGSITVRADPSYSFHNMQVVAYRISKAAENMLAVCSHQELGPQGVKVFAFCPGYVATSLGGNPEAMRKAGAGDASVSGKTLVTLIAGERDAEAGQFVHKDGVYPW